jgi:hypothetical protein
VSAVLLTEYVFFVLFKVWPLSSFLVCVCCCVAGRIHGFRLVRGELGGELLGGFPISNIFYSNGFMIEHLQ